MTIAPVAEVKAKLSEMVNASQEEAVVVTRNGKAVAVILGAPDDDALEDLILSHSRAFQDVVKRSREQFERGEGLSSEAFWALVKSDGPPPQKRGRRTQKG